MIHVGHPACGMNAVARGFVSVCISRGYEPYFVYNSWEGLTMGKIKSVTWNDVHHWTCEGGSLLATSIETADKIGLSDIATKLKEFDISGLAFQSACELAKGRDMYQELCIPMIVVPATIANNVPGCLMSIGCDTAINQICKACDELKQSASSVQKCVFIVEVGGDNCGCLATLSGIAAGADCAFIKEEPFTVRDVQHACNGIRNKLEFSGVKQGLIIRNENANPNLTTDFMYRLFNEEGKPLCTARKAILGHTQEGHKASPYDRAAGIKAGCRSTDWMISIMETLGSKDGVSIYSDSPSTVVVLVGKKDYSDHTPVLDLALQTDFENRLPKVQWWLKLRNLLKILAWPTKGKTTEHNEMISLINTFIKRSTMGLRTRK
ncbi:hypothetical protein Btru_006796 [Bulinus truncatus]|nr:hypothetical protein Btru_006796 [Bulinus truncatus]